ncbi:MAG: argininosuccinate lyase, partial [Clostridia bacterium]|nr:argininosuccinate lyase [Clostridia bacterium]
AHCVKQDKAILDHSLPELQAFHPAFQPDVYEAISLEACVERRSIPGAPAPEMVKNSIDAARKLLNS